MGKKGKGKSETIDLKNDPDICLGTGDFTLPNGDKYSGEYCAHRLGVIWRQGRGIYTTHDGQIYEGEWTDDKLIDNSELVIKYPAGAVYHGRLIKNKYNGPGIYSLTNRLDISCEFSNNQPQGEIALVDHYGKLWRGEAQKDQALLSPENIFYLLLPEDRGKGVSRIEEYEIATSSLNESAEEEEYPEEYWRDLIFAKSTMTDDDIDFANSNWYKQYKKFKKRKHEIDRKMAEKEPLEESEKNWLARLEEFKDQRKRLAVERSLAKKKSSAAAFDLIKKFRSPEFINSCPEVNVLSTKQEYADETSSSSSAAVSTSKFDKSRLRSKILVKKQRNRRSSRHNLPDILSLTTKANTTKLMEEMEEKFLHSTDIDPRCFVRKQTVQFNKPSATTVTEVVCPFRPKEKKYTKKITTAVQLHFTKERKEHALQMRVQKILERKQADEDQILLFSQAKQMVGEMEALKRSEGADVGSGHDRLSTIEELKTPSTTVKSSLTGLPTLDVTEDAEARVLRLINERVEQWQSEEEAKKKARAEKKVEKPRTLHMHSVGVDTESIPDIPKDIFIRIASAVPSNNRNSVED